MSGATSTDGKRKRGLVGLFRAAYIEGPLDERLERYAFTAVFGLSVPVGPLVSTKAALITGGTLTLAVVVLAFGAYDGRRDRRAPTGRTP